MFARSLPLPAPVLIPDYNRRSVAISLRLATYFDIQIVPTKAILSVSSRIGFIQSFL